MAQLVDREAAFLPSPLQGVSTYPIDFLGLSRREASAPGREFRCRIHCIVPFRRFSGFDYECSLRQANCAFAHGCARTQREGRSLAGNGPSLFRFAHYLRRGLCAPAHGYHHDLLRLRAISFRSAAAHFSSEDELGVLYCESFEFPAAHSIAACAASLSDIPPAIQSCRFRLYASRCSFAHRGRVSFTFRTLFSGFAGSVTNSANSGAAAG